MADGRGGEQGGQGLSTGGAGAGPAGLAAPRLACLQRLPHSPPLRPLRPAGRAAGPGKRKAEGPAAPGPKTPHKGAPVELQYEPEPPRQGLGGGRPGGPQGRGAGRAGAPAAAPVGSFWPAGALVLLLVRLGLQGSVRLPLLNLPGLSPSNLCVVSVVR